MTAGWARLFLGWIAYEQDDLAAAIDRFDAIVSDYRRMHLSCVREAMFGLALAYQAQGRERDADEPCRRELDRVVQEVIQNMGNREVVSAGPAG